MAARRCRRGRMARCGERARRRPVDAARPVGRAPAPSHMALLDERPARSPSSAIECPRRTVSVGRRAASARDPPGACDPRSLRNRADRRCPIRGRGSISASGTCSIRSARAAAPPQRAPYAFLPAEGESLHQIPVGPVHAGIIEPGHFRFTANGETVVRLEATPRLRAQGHRVADGGRRRSSRRRDLPARTSGDSTVAYALRLRSRGRGGARYQVAAARASICAR